MFPANCIYFGPERQAFLLKSKPFPAPVYDGRNKRVDMARPFLFNYGKTHNVAIDICQQ